MSLLVVVGACGPRKGTPCGSSVCNENEVCDEALELCVANLGPRLTIESPAAQALIGSPTFELRGRVDDDQGAPRSLEYAIAEGELAPLSFDGDGAFSARVATPAGDGAAVVIKVRATDVSNNASEASVAVRFDRTEPRCALLAPASGGTVQSANTLSAAIEASFEDGSKVTAEVSTDDGASWQPMSMSGTRGTFAWTLPAQTAREPRRLRVRGTDEAGNVCAVGPNTVYVDTVPPSLSLDGPDSGTICGPLELCQVRARIGDSSGTLPRMLYRLLDGGQPVEFPEAVTDPFRGSWQHPPVDFGAVDLEVIARDEAGNEASESRSLRVDHVPPAVTFQTPAEGALLNAADVADGGGAITVRWTVQDPSPSVTVLVAGGRGDAGTFSAATGAYVHTANAADNGQEYVTRVRATNAGGAETLAEHRFKLDVVPPTFSVSPANGARMTERAVRLSFHEPATTFANSSTALTWDAGGPALGQFLSLGDGGFAWLNLTPGTLYRGTLAPKGRDVAGNPIVQTTTFAFFTDPIAPLSGTVLITDAGTISAAFDQDGVVTFADSRKDAAGNIRVRWFDVHPATAAVTEKQSQLISALPASTHGTELSAWAAIAADGTTDRKTSMIQYIDTAATGFLRTSSGFFTQHGSPRSYVLPGAVSPDLPRTGFVDFGLISSSGTELIYSRPPNPDLTLPYSGSISIGGELSFMVWRARLVGTFPNLTEILERRVYVCLTLGAASSCDFTPGGVVTGGTGTPSVALTPTGRAVYVSTVANGQRVEHCQSEYRTAAGPCPVNECATLTRQWPATEELTVTSSIDGNLVMGAQESAGAYQILERTTLPCDTPWTVLFSMPSAGASKPIPVRFGTTRAALYRDSSGDVRVLR